MNDIMTERFLLAKERIQELSQEKMDSCYYDYIVKQAEFLQLLIHIYEEKEQGNWSNVSLKEKEEACYKLYADLMFESYETSYANPSYANVTFGKDLGRYLCYFYVRIRDAISFTYAMQQELLLIRMELFLQVVDALSQEHILHELKEILYYDAWDYCELFTEYNMNEMFSPEQNRFTKIVMESDFSDLSYLYEYGHYIGSNEKEMASFLAKMDVEQLKKMAATYTEGYRKGFELAGIDLSKKKTVNIRYPIGFEPMVRQAIIQFKSMGLEPVIYSKFNTSSRGVISTPPNKQYLYDHRFDDSLVLNHAFAKKKLQLSKKLYEEKKELLSQFAGPACIEVFGEKEFIPVMKEDALRYSKEQETVDIEFRRDHALMQNQYLKRDEYSFTIIAYPVPEISDDFEEIFEATVEVNTLNTEKYQKIQQRLIDELDLGSSVRITGKDGNETDLSVSLYDLKNPETETKFENCLADVNIPLGEVFTSPVLKGTNGLLHVKDVYLEGLKYRDLSLEFKDGMIVNYTCGNFDDDKKNKSYVKENVLNNRETLPMGEFAIGTNTKAYQMGLKYGISHLLPILIAEKTGPHFALGDTCYSMSEEIIVRNPDGKEVVAKENECSALRTKKPEDAYFNCHTDITIPYSELGDIVVVHEDGTETVLIHEGRFVLTGTEELNSVLD